MNERTRLHKVNIHKPTLHPDKIEQTFDQSRTDGVRLLASPAPPAADRGHRLPWYRSPDVADGEKRIVGYSTELRQDIYATFFQIARGPGSKITVPKSEALRLIQLGAWSRRRRNPTRRWSAKLNRGSRHDNQTYTVARGAVWVGNYGGTPGVLVPPQPTLYAAGSTIVLDTVEGARLTQLGFLVDPSKETVELGDSGVSQTVTVATP